MTEIYDSVANTLDIGPFMNKTRSRHTTTLLPDGRVLVMGGYNLAYLTSTEIYNPGLIEFRMDGGDYGTPGPLVDSVATISLTSLPVGTHTVTAFCNSDPNYTGGNSAAPVTQEVTNYLLFLPLAMD